MTRSSAKARLRRVLARRPPPAPPGHPEALARRVLGLSVVRQAGAVAAFVGRGHEPDTGVLLHKILEGGTAVWLPRVVDRRGQMVFHRANGLDALHEGEFGIPEPADDGVARDLRDLAVDAVLLPGLAFGQDGARLGHGFGFYDRALANLVTGPVLIGLCHDARLVAAGEIPMDPHDVAVDWVVTPTRVIQTGRDIRTQT